MAKKPTFPNRYLPVKTPPGGVAKPGAKPVGRGLKGGAFYNQEKFNASKAAHGPHGPGSPPQHPMPGHPSNNPTHYHGPATTGKIQGPAPRGAK